jgi:heme A synthase
VVTLTNPLGSGATLNSFVNDILKFVVRIGAIIVIFMLVYVGFLFVVARGESSKITTARNALLWTIVGALILLGAQAIAIGIQATVQAISTGN